MVLSAGSVEGHLIIVRWKLEIESDFNFCTALPESQLPRQRSICRSVPLEFCYPSLLQLLHQPDWIVADCLFCFLLLRGRGHFGSAECSDDCDR